MMQSNSGLVSYVPEYKFTPISGSVHNSIISLLSPPSLSTVVVICSIISSTQDHVMGKKSWTRVIEDYMKAS